MKDAEPHKIIVKVYFANQARIADVEWNAETSKVLNQLAKDDGIYYTTHPKDFEVLRPFEVR